MLITTLSVQAMIKLWKEKCSAASDEFHFTCLLFMLKVCLWGASVCIKWRYGEARRGSRRALKWIIVAVNVNWCCSRNHDWIRRGLSPHNLPHSGECITLHFHTFTEIYLNRNTCTIFYPPEICGYSEGHLAQLLEKSAVSCVSWVWGSFSLSFLNLKCDCSLLITLQGRSSLNK